MLTREDLQDLSDYLHSEYDAGRFPVPERLLKAIDEALRKD